MKLSRTTALLLGAAIFGLAAAAWLSRAAANSAAVEAAESPLVRTLRFSARVAAQSRVEAGSTVTGRVRQVHVREGDQVEAGQVLVSLDDEEARAALAQAGASERQAQLRLASLAGTSTLVAQAQLRQAEATLRAAEAELRRAEDLVQQGFISGSRLEEARRAVQVAAAQRDALVAQLDALGPSGGERAQAQAQWQAARAADAAAAARLVLMDVRAPARARVLARLAEPGQVVQAGKPLIGLALRSPPTIVAQVDERFLGQLQVGQSAVAVADAYPSQPLQARVASIAPLVDAQKGSVEVKLAFIQAPPAFVREDMTVSVDVVTAERARALVVPAGAVRQGELPERAIVLVERDGHARARAVSTGLRTVEAVEITAGLRAGERVLLEPGLRDGQRVRVRPAGATAGGVPAAAAPKAIVPMATGGQP